MDDIMSSLSISSGASGTPNHSYISYKSDFDTDVNIDKAYKNKLYNMEDDHDNLFQLKNDFFSNYGTDMFKQANVLYKRYYEQSNIELFDELLYNNAKNLIQYSNKNKSICCVYTSKQDLASLHVTTRELYNVLFIIKVNSAKVKLWLECVAIVKMENNVELS